MCGDEDRAPGSEGRASSSEHVGLEDGEATPPIGVVPPAGPVMPTAQGSATETVGQAVEPEVAANQVADALERISADLSSMSRRIDELARLGNRREELIDRLHSENQKLRAGEVAQVQAPVLRELIRSYDLAVTLAREGSPAARDLDLVRHRLLDGLEQAGVRPLEPDRGAEFDPSFHSAAQRVTTDDPGLDMTVAQTVRVGFVQDGQRVLRPADVAVHRYAAPSSAVPGESTNDLGAALDREE